MDVGDGTSGALGDVDESGDQFSAALAVGMECVSVCFGARDAGKIAGRRHNRVGREVERQFDERSTRCAFLEALGCVAGEEPSAVDVGHALTKLVGLFHVMRRHHDRATLRMQVAQNFPESESCLWIETDRRLVEEDDFWLVDECTRNHETLLLSAGQSVDFGVCLVRDTEPLKQFLGATLGSSHGKAKVGRVKNQVLDGRERAIGIGTLRHDADALAHAHFVRCDVQSGDHRSAAACLHASRQYPNGSRLPGPVRAEEAEKLPFANGQVERVECDDAIARFAMSARDPTTVRGMHSPSRSSRCAAFYRRRGIDLT